MSAHVIRHRGHHYLVIKVSSTATKARVRLTELNRHGGVIKRMIITIKTNNTETLRIPYSSKVSSVRLSVVS